MPGGLCRRAGFEIPDGFAFVDELPKTSVGKFDAEVLRSRHAAGAVAGRGRRPVVSADVSLQLAGGGPARLSCQPRIRPSRCASRSPKARTSRTIHREAASTIAGVTQSGQSFMARPTLCRGRFVSQTFMMGYR